MSKKQKGFGVVEALLILVIAGLVSFIGWYAWRQRSDTNKTSLISSQESEKIPIGCEATAGMKATGNYNVPCRLAIVFKEPYPSTQQVAELIKPLGGVLVKEYADLYDMGVYTINVKLGTEDKAIEYLKAQPGVESASRDHCCATNN